MLLILLALPAFVFLFFRFFGNNYYDLPVYHPLVAEGQVVRQGADTVYYRVEGLLGTDRSGSARGSEMLEGRINLVCYPDSDSRTDHANLINELRRLETAFRNEEPVQGIIVAAQEEMGWQKALDPDFWTVLVDQTTEKQPGGLATLLKLDRQPLAGRTFPEHCGLVLIDGNRQIRGYYQQADESEIDRLMAEIKILLYQNSTREK